MLVYIVIQARPHSEQDRASLAHPFPKLYRAQTKDQSSRGHMTQTQQGEILGMPRDESKQHANAGILVLSLNRKVLYANKAAHDFLTRLNRIENDPSTNGAFPRSVDSLLSEVLRLLRAAVLNCDWKHLEAKGLVADAARPLLVQAFAIPDRLGIQRSRIVLTIQETSYPGTS